MGEKTELVPENEVVTSIFSGINSVQRPFSVQGYSGTFGIVDEVSFYSAAGQAAETAAFQMRSFATIFNNVSTSANSIRHSATTNITPGERTVPAGRIVWDEGDRAEVRRFSDPVPYYLP